MVNDCVERFRGMFAIAIYDSEQQEIIIFRDRAGVKPLYYSQKDDALLFSSELKPCLNYPDFNKDIDFEAVSSYLQFGYIHAPKTIFKTVQKLFPGHYLKYSIASKELVEECYWNINDFYEHQVVRENVKEELEATMIEAFNLRMIADVPVGVFLSGGVDSSLVSAIATNNSTSSVKTFSVKFNEKGFDESLYAKEVADHLKTHHHVIECNYDDGIDLIQNFTYYYDEPFADSSAIPSMLLAKHTKKHVTVALSGDGGDESFIGYHRYKWAKKGGQLYVLPLAIRNIGGKLLSLAPHYRLKVIAKALQYTDRNDAYLSVMTGVDQSYIKTDFNTGEVDELKYLYHDHKNFYERISDFDIKTCLH